jgi:hypothetical protein
VTAALLLWYSPARLAVAAVVVAIADMVLALPAAQTDRSDAITALPLVTALC